MRDVIYLLVIVGFFAMAAGVVRLCERVIGHDDSQPAPASAPEPVTASGTDR